MSFKSAIKVIESSSIGFSCLEDLNDPFECTSFGFIDRDDSLTTANVSTIACKNRFSRNYGVLSLTRQPLNPLMWAHYGDDHQGVVVGFDAEIAGFSDENDNVIPYQFGEIIYSATKPNGVFETISTEELMKIGNKINFDSSIFNLVKRAFLYKSIDWAYEEEVRVVKDISDIPFSYHASEGRFGSWNKIEVNGRPIYCLDVPKKAIKEVYMGRHIYKNVTKKKEFSQKDLKDVLFSWRQRNFHLFQCEPDVKSWSLNATKLIDHYDGNNQFI